MFGDINSETRDFEKLTNKNGTKREQNVERGKVMTSVRKWPERRRKRHIYYVEKGETYFSNCKIKQVNYVGHVT